MTQMYEYCALPYAANDDMYAPRPWFHIFKTNGVTYTQRLQMIRTPRNPRNMRARPFQYHQARENLWIRQEDTARCYQSDARGWEQRDAPWLRGLDLIAGGEAIARQIHQDRIWNDMSRETNFQDLMSGSEVDVQSVIHYQLRTDDEDDKEDAQGKHGAYDADDDESEQAAIDKQAIKAQTSTCGSASAVVRITLDTTSRATAAMDEWSAAAAARQARVLKRAEKHVNKAHKAVTDRRLMARDIWDSVREGMTRKAEEVRQLVRMQRHTG